MGFPHSGQARSVIAILVIFATRLRHETCSFVKAAGYNTAGLYRYCCRSGGLVVAIPVVLRVSETVGLVSVTLVCFVLTAYTPTAITKAAATAPAIHMAELSRSP